jgi:hypothetical protein
VTSERKIAANRRNALKSTGPRSASGKKRSSKNSFRHGLTKPLSGTEFMRELDKLTRQIAENGEHRFDIELAQAAAEAELELTRVRRRKVDLIEGVAALTNLNSLELFASSTEETARIMRQVSGVGVGIKRPGFAIDSLSPILAELPDQTAEVIRRALPELVSLERYETRAAGQRNRAMRVLMRSQQKSNET